MRRDGTLGEWAGAAELVERVLRLPVDPCGALGIRLLPMEEARGRRFLGEIGVYTDAGVLEVMRRMGVSLPLTRTLGDARPPVEEPARLQRERGLPPYKGGVRGRKAHPFQGWDVAAPPHGHSVARWAELRLRLLPTNTATSLSPLLRCTPDELPTTNRHRGMVGVSPFNGASPSPPSGSQVSKAHPSTTKAAAWSRGIVVGRGDRSVRARPLGWAPLPAAHQPLPLCAPASVECRRSPLQASPG